jgi:hypothetical protein
MTSKQALKIALESGNKEFLESKNAVDERYKQRWPMAIIFVVDGERFMYHTDAVDLKCNKFKSWSRIEPIVIR